MANPRARSLVEKFEQLSASIPFTPKARRTLETFFYSNYGKFALQGEEDRLLQHFEECLDTFGEELSVSLKARAVYGRPQIDHREIVDALARTAERKRGQTNVRPEEKLPPPDF